MTVKNDRTELERKLGLNPGTLDSRRETIKEITMIEVSNIILADVFKTNVLATFRVASRASAGHRRL